MEKSTVRIERTDRIATLLLDKPPVNAVDLTVLHDAERCLDQLEAMEDIGAVIITGVGKCFCAGLDLKVAVNYGPKEQREMVHSINRVVLRLYALPIPTIAAVHGHAIAGGFFMVIACDYRIGASSDIKIGVTETRAGVPFPFATMELIKKELAPAVARRLTLVGLNIPPREALALGILDELEPSDRVLSRAMEVAGDLSTIPRNSYAVIKRQLRGDTISRIEEVIISGGDPLLDSWITDEAREASPRLLSGEDGEA